MAGSQRTRLMTPPMSPEDSRLLSPAGTPKSSEVQKLAKKFGRSSFFSSTLDEAVMKAGGMSPASVGASPRKSAFLEAMDKANGRSPGSSDASLLKGDMSPELDVRETALLAQKLRMAQTVLDEERALGDREKEVLRERLRFSESQDEAARERLAAALASLRAQNSELQDSAIQAMEVDKEKEADFKATCSVYENELQQLRGEAKLAFEEVRQANDERNRLAASLQKCNADEAAVKDAGKAELKRVESELQHKKQEVEGIRVKTEADLALAVAEQQRLQQEVQELQRKSEISRREADFKAEQHAAQQAVLEAQRDAKNRECLDLDSRQRLEHAQLEETMRVRLEALQLRLENECQVKDRLNNVLTAEVQEKTRLLGVLTEESASLRSRERSEVLVVDRLESELERRVRASVQDEAASLLRVEYREREAIAELRAQARSELRVELREAETTADAEARLCLLQGESLERERQAELRNEHLGYSGEAEWRLRALYDDEVRSVTTSKICVMQQAEMREKELLNELRQARDTYRDLETSHDAQTAALQVTAAKERELHADRIERLRGELHSELRDQKQSSEQHWRQLLDSSERAAERAAERRERSAHEELHGELRRLREQLNMVAQYRREGHDVAGGSAWWNSVMESVGGHEAVVEMKRKLEELADLCKQQEVKERELKLELLDYKEHRFSDSKLENQLQDANRSVLQQEAALRAQFESNQSMLRASLHSELADAKSNCHREADVATRAMSRCSGLERQLQEVTSDNTTLRTRIQHLEAEFSKLSKLGTDGEIIREECRWRTLQMENALRNTEAEAKAAKADAQQSALELQHVVSASQKEETRVGERLRQEVQQSAVDLQEARAAERTALQEWKRSEDKRKREMVTMDALISDTRALALSLTEHQHLADGLNNMIKRHEAAVSPRGSPRVRSPVPTGSPLPHRTRTTSPPGTTARESLSAMSARLSERPSTRSPRPSRELAAGSSRLPSPPRTTVRESLTAMTTRLPDRPSTISPLRSRELTTGSSQLPERWTATSPLSSSLLTERLSATSPLPSRDLATGSSRPSDTASVLATAPTWKELPTGSSRTTDMSSAISTLPSRDVPSGSLRTSTRSSSALSPRRSWRELPSSSSRPSEWPSAFSPLLSSKELTTGNIPRQAERPLASASLASADLLTSSALRMKELPLETSMRSADTVLGGGSAASRDLTSTSLSSTGRSAQEGESLADRRVRESHMACNSALALQSEGSSTLRSSSAAALEVDRHRMRQSQSPLFQTGRRSESALLAEVSMSKEGKRVSWESSTPLSTPPSRRKLLY